MRYPLLSVFQLSLTAILLFASCERSPDPAVDSEPSQPAPAILAEVRAQAGGDPHKEVQLLAEWLRNRYARVTAPATAAPSLHDENAPVNPVGAAALFAALTEELGFEVRYRLLYNEPATGFYPLVEVLDSDGDHLWDPYAGRYFVDAEGTPLAYADAASGTARYVAGTDAPNLPPAETLFGQAVTEVSTDRAAVYPIPIASSELPWTIGTADGSAADIQARRTPFGPALAPLGVNAPLPGRVVAPQLRFSGLDAGGEYVLEGGLVSGSPESVVAMGRGLRPLSSEYTPMGFRLRYAADSSTATLTLGVAAGDRVEVDFLRWGRP